MEKQRTIDHVTECEGVGLHTGNKSKVIFKPSRAGEGIRFIRMDLPGKPVIEAHHTNVFGALRGTTIGLETAQVHTIEHILAACSSLGIDNLEILLTNNEPPVMDGSARAFAEAILSAGYKEQDAEREYFTVDTPVIYESGKTSIAAYPADHLSIDCTISYDHPLLKHQQACFTLNRETFLSEIAPARTFCFDYEIEALKARGLAKGGDFSNAIVVGLHGIHNPEKLRFPDEFVRHKTLDLIGDLYLLGKPIKARIVAVRCGHNHNINFVKTLLNAFVH